MAFEQLPLDPRIEQIITAFARAEAYIADSIAELLSHNRGLGTRRWLQRRLALIHQGLTQLRTDAQQGLPHLAQDSFEFGVAIATAESELSAAFGRDLPRGAIDVLARAMVGRVDGSVVTVGRRVDDVFRRIGLKQVAQHLLAAEGHDKAAELMQQALVKEGTRAFVDKAGREWSLSAYSSMVIRTTTREAVTQGTLRGLKASGSDLVQVSHHAGSCDLCAEYDGNTYSISGDDLTYPKLEATPPYHPNCRHVIGPATVAFDRLEAELEAWAASRA